MIERFKVWENWIHEKLVGSKIWFLEWSNFFSAKLNKTIKFYSELFLLEERGHYSWVVGHCGKKYTKRIHISMSRCGLLLCYIQYPIYILYEPNSYKGLIKQLHLLYLVNTMTLLIFVHAYQGLQISSKGMSKMSNELNEIM